MWTQLRLFLTIASVCGFLLPPHGADAAAAPSRPPNIVLILADDLGYGDVGCYGATKVQTPNIDRLAREGRLFTDAHAPAAVCTPTRYALLTGREFWRYGRKWQGESLLQNVSVTVPSLLKSAGYTTACIGKWHLGFGKTAPDWNGTLSPGPLEAGFDTYFGTPRAHNEPPQVFVQDHRVVNLDPGDPIRIQPPGGGYAHGTMEGGKAARFRGEDLAVVTTQKAIAFIEQNAGRPFFLDFATNGVHVPITPNPRFQGTSQCGPYGDFIHELDWSVGEILGTLDRLHLAENTLVLFSSDNGAVLHRGVVKAGHRPNGQWLGQKTDVWEGGHRVPFLARWPGHVPAGTRTSELVSLTDMLATCAAIVGRPLPDGAGPDSFNILPALRDEPNHPAVRPILPTIGIQGVSIREGRWVLYPKAGSGGYSADPDDHHWTHFWEIGDTNSDYDDHGRRRPDAPPGQLYDLVADPHESRNVYAQHPEIVKRLSERLQSLRKGKPSRS
jgi:arylsulfatase A